MRNFGTIALAALSSVLYFPTRAGFGPSTRQIFFGYRVLKF